MLNIITDSREQAPFTFSDQVAVTIKALTVGDYSIEGLEDQIVIERKSLGDLIGSICQGRERFTKELRQLRAFHYAAIVIEADWTDILDHKYQSDMNPTAVIASLMSFSLKYRIQVILAGDHAKASKLVERLLSLYVAMIQRDYKAISVGEEHQRPKTVERRAITEVASGPAPGGRYARAANMMEPRKS